LQLGNLAQVVGRSTQNTTFTWNLQQLHFHWGRTGKNDEGSEHYLYGQRYPIEVHFVHWNSKYSDFLAAVSSGNSDALLVVGVFFRIDSTDVNLMVQIAQNASTLTRSGSTLNDLKLSDLFDGEGHFHSYAGGLTTPTCLEIVTWVVMTATKPITQATLDKIKQAKENPPASTTSAGPADTELISLYGNFRPIQRTNNRNIWASDTANPGAACAASVSNPVFTCNSAAHTLMMFSPITLLFSLSAFMLSGL